MVGITEISAIVAASGVLMGVAYYILTIRHQSHMIQQQNKMRQTDLVVRLYSTLFGKEFLDASMKITALKFKDYQDYVNKYGPILSVGKYGLEFNDTTELRALLIVDNFFMEVGILLYRGLIDAGLVRDIFTYRVELLWRKIEPLIHGVRKESNQSEMGKWFEYLYNEIKKHEQRGADVG